MDSAKRNSVNVRLVKSKNGSASDAQNVSRASKAQIQSNSKEEWLAPSADLNGLRMMAVQSSILPQCIRAYKNNIAGYGLGVRYTNDYSVETAEMKAEYDKLTEIINNLNYEKEAKEVFEDAIEARETFGIAFLEITRNDAGEPCHISFIRDTPLVRKTLPLEPVILTHVYSNGKEEFRNRKFCKYKIETSTSTVYFKEIGDPRVMDKFTGEYLDYDELMDSTKGASDAQIEPENYAAEIMELKIGTSDYGDVRWFGQVLGIDGSRRAESLNNKYFEEGRHTPLLIMVKGGTLTDDSFSRLREYMDGVKGEAGQHAFMILEAERAQGLNAFSDDKTPEVEIKSLASMLQKDELFQDYLDNNRKKVQSAFLLPDVFVGYTSEFNRATAQAALEVTERQIFKPERRSLGWLINNKILCDYKFKFVEAYFLEPDVSDPDALTKLLDVMERAGGITPNKAKEIVMNALGKTAEDYEGDWGNVPLAYRK